MDAEANKCYSTGILQPMDIAAAEHYSHGHIADSRYYYRTLQQTTQLPTTIDIRSLLLSL